MSSRNAAPRLGSSLIARKGEAAPTVAVPEPQHEVERLAVAVEDMPSTTPRGLVGTIAVTVRLDPTRYEHLKIHGVKTRRTNQEILIEALDDYFAAKAPIRDY
jgi:hypothetical protein